MTIFSELKLPRGNAAKHRLLADHIARRIETGELEPGVQLPPVRRAAWSLGCYPGTVARAYAALRTRGLVYGEVGRGTFVGAGCESKLSSLPIVPAEDGMIDMTLNSFTMLPPTEELAAAFRRLADGVTSDPRLSGYSAAGGSAGCRKAGLEWVSNWVGGLGPNEIAVVSGGQSGLHAAIASLVTPGAGVACEDLTYPGTIAACAQHGVPLTGVAIDEQGMIPQALDEVCQRHPIALLVISTSINNPTGVCLPPERREAIAELARRHDFLIVEDEVYGFLGSGDAPLISNLAPERCLFLCTFSKIVAPALRVGYMAGRETLIRRIELAHKNTTMMTSPYLSEIASDLIRRGMIKQRVAQMRRIVNARRDIAKDVLGHFGISPARNGLVWLPLGGAWRSWDFCREVERAGIKISPSDVFAVEPGRMKPAVRISLTSEPDEARLRKGLEIIAGLMERPRPAPPAFA